MTVAVLAGAKSNSIYDRREPDDFEVSWFSGTGCGGQHRNKHQNSARVRHIPSGVVRTAQTRSRENSLKDAMDAILAELDRLAGRDASTAENAIRRAAVGSGERSDKRRTYRFQEGRVHDHQTGRSALVDRVMSGDFSALWR